MASSSRHARRRKCAPRWRRPIVEQFESRTLLANLAPSGSDHTILNALEDVRYSFQLSDFPFSDGDGNTQALQAVKVATLPALGVLIIAGGPNGGVVSTGDFISAADIAAGKLTFQGYINASGSPYTSFTFQVKDNGGTAVVMGVQGVDVDPTPNTMTINVLPVNDPPQGTNRTVMTHEDLPIVFSAADFGYSDPLDNPTNGFLGVMITSLPIPGSLKLAGFVVFPGQFIPVAQLPGLAFSPAANANDGNSFGTIFAFKVQDDGGTSNGGINVDPTPNTITINVLSVNDPPISADKSILALEDIPYTFTAGDFAFFDINDSPSNGLKSVLLSTPPAAFGTISVNAVAQLPSTPIIIDAATILYANKLVFTPAANFNGSGSLAFHLEDNGGTANGGVDTDPTPNTITINVTPVNDAPSGLNNTVTTLEDTAYTFHAADFGFSDPHDTPSDLFLSVIIASTPTNGILFLGTSVVASGFVALVTDIQSGLLRFVPEADANGVSPPYDGFTFRVRDSGGTAFGGVNSDPIPRTMSIGVVPVNDAPEGFDKTVTMLEDTPYTIRAVDFGFFDRYDYSPPSSQPPNDLKNVIVPAAPTNGTLLVANVPITTFPATIARAEFDSNNVRFAPLVNATTAGGYSFTLPFRLQDDGGTANGGWDTSLTTNTITFNVVVLNHAPSGSDHTVSNALEDVTYSFQLSDFPFNDGDGGTQSLRRVMITALPTLGALTLIGGLNGGVVSAGWLISAADIAAGKLRFLANPNANGLPYTSLTFQVQDNGGTAVVQGVPGVDLDPTPNTLTIDVLPVNDPPSGQSGMLTKIEDSVFHLNAAEFFFSDPLDNPPNAFQSITITSISTPGSLTFQGNPVVPNQVILAANLSGLVFTPAPDTNGPFNSPFTFAVSDDGGTANGGIDTDPTPNTLSASMSAVNDPPIGVPPGPINASEDHDYRFQVGDFGFTDPHDQRPPSSSPNDPNSLAAVRFTTLPLPAAGTILLAGQPIAAGTEVSAAIIAGGQLMFRPAANSFGANFGSFTYQLRDTGGRDYGGIDLQPAAMASTLTIDVAAVNDPPSFAAGGGQTATDESGPQMVAGWASALSAGPAGEAGQKLHFEIQSNDHPELFAAGPAVDAAGNLSFAPQPGTSGTAQVTFVLKDDGGTAQGGVDTSAAQTLTVHVAYASPWHNRGMPLDVSGDGKIMANDALAAINYINAFGSGPAPPSGAAGGPLYYDVNGDGYLAPNDVVAIINYINAFGPDGEGEGEGGGEAGMPMSDLLAMLAADLASQPRRRR